MLSEYACELRLIVSQTQVDFKAGEYVDPAYIAYVQEEVTKATLQEAEVQEITEIGRRNIRSGDEPDQIRKGEGSAGNNDRHYIPGLPIERPMTSPPSYDSSPQRNSSYINHGHEALARAAPLQSVVVLGRPVDSIMHLSPLVLDHQAWMIPKGPQLGPMLSASEQE